MIPHFIKRIYTKYKYGVSCCKAYSLHYNWAKQLKREIIGYRKIANKHIDLKYLEFDKEIDKILLALDIIINLVLI